LGATLEDMTNKLSRAATAAALAALATIGILAVAGGAATAGTDDHRHEQVFHLTAQTDQLAFVDNGPPGPSVGDQLIFSDRIHRAGHPIGTAASTCTIARITSPTMTCHLTVALALPDGQITLHGSTETLDHPPTAGEQIRFTLAVTGGTGHYRTARGHADGLDTGSGEEHYTIHLTR
jgi:hypothetical protein